MEDMHVFFPRCSKIFPRTVLIHITKGDYLARSKIFYNNCSIYHRSSLGLFFDSSRHWTPTLRFLVSSFAPIKRLSFKMISFQIRRLKIILTAMFSASSCSQVFIHSPAQFFGFSRIPIDATSAFSPSGKEINKERAGRWTVTVLYLNKPTQKIH